MKWYYCNYIFILQFEPNSIKPNPKLNLFQSLSVRIHPDWGSKLFKKGASNKYRIDNDLTMQHKCKKCIQNLQPNSFKILVAKSVSFSPVKWSIFHKIALFYWKLTNFLWNLLVLIHESQSSVYISLLCVIIIISEYCNSD